MDSSKQLTPWAPFPAEIRHKILCYTIPFSSKLVVPNLNILTEPTRRDWRRNRFPGQILRVSKAFKIELAPYVYGSRHFILESPYECMVFVRRISKTNAMHIKMLTVRRFTLDPANPLRVQNGMSHDSGFQLYAPVLAQNCPSLTYFALGSITLQGQKWNNKDKWSIPDLEKLHAAHREFPNLPNVHYSTWQTILKAEPQRLGAEDPHPEVLKVDLKQLIEDLKAEAKARRVAGGKKAALTRKANKDMADADAEEEE